MPGERKYGELIFNIKKDIGAARKVRNFATALGCFRQLIYGYNRLEKWRFKVKSRQKTDATKQQLDEKSTNPSGMWVKQKEVTAVIAEWSGVSDDELTRNDVNRLLTIDKKLQAQVIGQNSAIASVVQALQRARIGLRDKSKPIGVFLFVGTTGVGKTELARIVAKEFYGGQDRIVRFDMSEFMERHSTS